MGILNRHNSNTKSFGSMLILLVCLLPVLPLSAQNLCESVLLLRDTTILPGETVGLHAHGLFEYTWQPAEGLTNSHDSVQTVSPIVTTDYIVTGRYISGNLVPDGDFESGNGDFVSEYLNGTPTTSPYYSNYGILGAVGTYTINTTSANVHTNFGTHPCLDHTFGNGSGHCMYVNGASVPNVIVWQEELYDIVPNTDYIFITWLATLSPNQTNSNTDQLAHLQFSINGVTIKCIEPQYHG